MNINSNYKANVILILKRIVNPKINTKPNGTLTLNQIEPYPKHN